MPYQSGGNRRNNLQLGVGRPMWFSALPAIPERVLDGIPGFLAWLSLLLIVAGTVKAPWVVFSIAVLISAYTAIRMVLGGFANLRGLRLIRQWEATDWRQEYIRRRIADSLAWEDVLHVVTIPNYKEDLDILRQTLKRLAASPIARQQVAVVMAMEAGEPQSAAKAVALKQEYGDQFRHIVVSIHPKGLSGELQGKSANESWAVRHAKRYLVDELGYKLDNLLVTICDADSLIHPKYLECLTCLFATSIARHATEWQAPIRYHSNIWSIHPALGLVQAYSAAWELAYLAAPWWHPLPISTYSVSLRMVDEVGYWDTDVIAEDVHMFIKCLFRRSGKLELGRVYLPFSGNSVTGNTFFEACKNRYTQTLRHAWGAKEVGYTMAQIIERPDIPLGRGLQILFRVAHDNIMAGAGWIIVTLGQAFPLLLQPVLAQQILASPQFVVLQITYATLAILGVVFWWIDLRLRPPRPHGWTIKEIGLTLLSFVILPFLTFIFVALPVMQAQTRLLLGMPIQYRVARKI